MIDIKTATITSKGQIVIPKEVRELGGFAEGKKIVVLSFKDRLEIRPMEWLERMEPALLSEKALGKVWDTPEEDEAWKDL